MEREKLIKFCQDSAAYFEHHTNVDWEAMDDEELERFADWFDYLWDK